VLFSTSDVLPPVGHECVSTADLQLESSDHINDALISLHWLRVPERIQYKIAVLTYKVLCGTVPRYLGPLTRVGYVHGRRSLRSP